MKIIKTMACLGAFMLALGTQAQVDKKILGERHAMIKLQQGKKYLLLPVEEKEEHAHIRVVRNNQLVKTINCRLAVNNVDYFVPYEIGEGNSLTSPSTETCALQGQLMTLPAGNA